MSETVQPGIYVHYKGKHYRVLFEAVETDSRAVYVVYVPLHGDGKPTIRLKSDFVSPVLSGVNPPYTRFERIGD